MAVTTKKTFSATTNATTTTFSPVSIQLNNQDDLDVYVTLSGGTRVLQLRQSTGSTAQSSHPQVNNTDGLYYPAVSAGTTLYNYQLSTDNNTITFNSALPQGAVVFCERRTRDADSSYTTFASGSTIRATDLNNSARESNFTAQEARNKAFDLEGKIYNTLGQANLVVKTTDTGTVDSTMIANGTIVNADINASADIQGSKLLDDSVTLDKLGSGALPTDITVASANLVDGTIVNADINSSANIDGDKLANDSVSLGKLEGGALPTDITVASTNIVDGTIVNADINASAAIAGTKVTPAFGSQNVSTSGTLASGAQTVTGNIAVSGTVDGRDVAADGTKLDGIESGATADQTAAEIRALTEAATDSNVFTDADHTKLNGIETGATADQTNAEIKTAYEANANTNEFSDAEQSKLAGIETAATQDQTASEIKTLLQSDKLTLSEINTTSTDSRYYTETELNAGQLDNRYYTETEAEALFLRQDSSETIASGVTWSSNDSKVATTAAIDLRIIELVDDVGGFVPIANETSFPSTNPDINTSGSAKGGTIVSVQAASTNLTAQSGTTLTIANGRGTGNAVIITGVSATIPSGYGFLVETTATDHTYAFHRLVPKATEVATVAANATNIAAAGANVTNIDSFADRYQISTSAPTTRADNSSLTNGDLWFDSSSNKVMMVYDGSSGDGYSPITPNQATLTNINIVAGHVTYTEDLGNITDALNTGSGNNSVNTVGSNIAAVNTVAADLNETTSEIDTVATSIANVNTVGNAIANVNTVAGISSNVTSVANNSTNINAVQSNATNINAVAGNNSNITAVANNATNINAVQANASNINAAVSNASNINSAVSNATNINTVAASISDVNRYAAEYLIQSGTPSSPSAGDLWYNSTANTLNYYTGGAWVGISPGIAGLINDASPALANHLDCNDKNLTEVGTVSGNNLQLDFGTV